MAQPSLLAWTHNHQCSKNGAARQCKLLLPGLSTNDAPDHMHQKRCATRRQTSTGTRKRRARRARPNGRQPINAIISQHRPPAILETRSASALNAMNVARVLWAYILQDLDTVLYNPAQAGRIAGSCRWRTHFARCVAERLILLQRRPPARLAALLMLPAAASPTSPSPTTLAVATSNPSSMSPTCPAAWPCGCLRGGRGGELHLTSR